VEVSLLRMIVSLCCTSGWSTTVTPCICCSSCDLCGDINDWRTADKSRAAGEPTILSRDRGKLPRLKVSPHQIHHAALHRGVDNGAVDFDRLWSRRFSGR